MIGKISAAEMYDLLSKADWQRMGDTLRQLTPGAKKRIKQLNVAEKRYEDHRRYHTAMLLEAAGILIAGGMDIESVSVIVAGSARSKIDRINSDTYIPDEADQGGRPSEFWSHKRLSDLRESIESARSETKGRKANHVQAALLFRLSQSQTDSTGAPLNDGFDDLFYSEPGLELKSSKQIQVSEVGSGKKITVSLAVAATNKSYRAQHIDETIEKRIKHEIKQAKKQAAHEQMGSADIDAAFEEMSE